jgi:hypothetical protein
LGCELQVQISSAREPQRPDRGASGSYLWGGLRDYVLKTGVEDKIRLYTGQPHTARKTPFESGASRYRFKKSADLLFKFGEIVVDGGPHYTQIDGEDFMDRYVAHPAHSRPWNIWMLLDEVRGCAGDLVHGLADDLDVSNDGILNLRVRLKGLEVR